MSVSREVFESEATAQFDEEGDLVVCGEYIELRCDEDLLQFRAFIDREIQRRCDAARNRAEGLARAGR